MCSPWWKIDKMLYGCFIYAMPIVIYKVLIIQPSSPLQLPCRYVFIFELFCLDEYTTLPIDFLENNRVVLMLLGWKDDVLSLSLSLSLLLPPSTCSQRSLLSGRRRHRRKKTRKIETHPDDARRALYKVYGAEEVIFHPTSPFNWAFITSDHILSSTSYIYIYLFIQYMCI